MREGMCFRAGRALTAVSAAATLFVFGAGPVRAQTAPGLAVAAAAAPADQAQAGTRRLSIDEAVAMALEQNVNLQVDRIDPQIQDYNISVARSGWTPIFFSNLSNRSQTNPPQDVFGGNQISITNENITSNLGVQQALPWGGGIVHGAVE